MGSYQNRIENKLILMIQRIIFCLVAPLFLFFFESQLQAQPFTFTSIRPLSLSNLEYGEILFVDLDRDGILELIGTGNSENLPPFVPHAYVAVNQEPYSFADGTEGLVFSQRALGQGVWQSSMAITDYDRDGNMDIIVAGRIHNGSSFETRPLKGVTQLYRGGASASFLPVATNLVGAYGGKVSVADIDGDGDEDLLISGLITPDEVVTRLYRNTDGTFEQVMFPHEALTMGDIEWADVDNDGDLDLAFSGVSASGVNMTKLYRNNGLGSYSEDTSSNLPGLSFSAMDWGDYDGDGDLDLVLSGARYHETKYLEAVIQVWRNENGRLSDTGIELDSVIQGDVAWGDYDSDGSLDLVVVGGADIYRGRVGYVYHNEAGNLKARISIPGLAASSAIWGDYDGDQDLDLTVTGSSVNNTPVLRIFRNNSRIFNTPPSAPSGLKAQETDGVVTLSWQQAADEQTVAASLSYNLRIGTASGQENVMVSFSDPVTGRRLKVDRGNAGLQTFWKLHSLPEGTYVWSVQAIDQGYAASAWSEEQSFRVTDGGGKLTRVEEEVRTTTMLQAGYPNPFTQEITIPFTLKEPSSVEISIYNILGSRVERLLSESLMSGTHHVQWTGTDERGAAVAAGLYLVRLNAGGVQHVQHVTLIR